MSLSLRMDQNHQNEKLNAFDKKVNWFVAKPYSNLIYDPLKRVFPSNRYEMVYRLYDEVFDEGVRAAGKL
jgi:hypothetical protein